MDQSAARKRLESERERLLALREDLVNSEGLNDIDSVRDVSLGDDDPTEIGSELTQKGVTLAMVEQIDFELVEIGRALKKVDLGTYGKSEISGKDIGTERLEVFPYAKYTVEEQQAIEGGGLNVR